MTEQLKISASEAKPGDKSEFPGMFTEDGTPWHYLDSAATAQKPQIVLDSVAWALGEGYATVHRGVYSRSARMTMGYEAARRRVAPFWRKVTPTNPKMEPKSHNHRCQN